jgi:transketolase
MRNAFSQQIVELAAADERVVVLSGDIGNRMFDQFKERFPARFVNCGIAEQSMISIAAGLAMCGLRPFVYTIAPFVTARCLEQIRVDLCYHNLPVCLVGVGAGLGYAELGVTHHACEDIAMLRCLPGMTVVCPGDAWEVKAAVNALLHVNGPAYLRLGKKGEPLVHREVPSEFVIGRGLNIEDGSDVCILNTGNTLPIAVEAARVLRSQSITARVVNFHTVKPLDMQLLAEVFGKYELVITLEEHSMIGGLGSSVSEWLADVGPQRARMCRLGTPDQYSHISGGQSFLRGKYGLSAEHVVKRVLWQLMQHKIERVA